MDQSPQKNQSVQEQVFLSLRKSILDLTLLPGTAMSANDISRRMDVSRTPVREAFIRLEREGLVQAIPQRETVVSRIDLTRAWQEQFLRENLESAVLQSFCERQTKQDISHLHALIEQQRKLGAAGDYIGLITLDDAFHRVIFQVAGQPLCWEIIESMSGHYRRTRLLTVWVEEITSNILAQHETLVTQLERSLVTDAEKTLRNHVRKLSVEQQMLTQTYPDFFVPEKQTPAFDLGPSVFQPLKASSR